MRIRQRQWRMVIMKLKLEVLSFQFHSVHQLRSTAQTSSTPTQTLSTPVQSSSTPAQTSAGSTPAQSSFTYTQFTTPAQFMSSTPFPSAPIVSSPSPHITSPGFSPISSGSPGKLISIVNQKFGNTSRYLSDSWKEVFLSCTHLNTLQITSLLRILGTLHGEVRHSMVIVVFEFIKRTLIL